MDLQAKHYRKESTISDGSTGDNVLAGAFNGTYGITLMASKFYWCSFYVCVHGTTWRSDFIRASLGVDGWFKTIKILWVVVIEAIIIVPMHEAILVLVNKIKVQQMNINKRLVKKWS